MNGAGGERRSGGGGRNQSKFPVFVSAACSLKVSRQYFKGDTFDFIVGLDSSRGIYIIDDNSVVVCCCSTGAAASSRLPHSGK